MHWTSTSGTSSDTQKHSIKYGEPTTEKGHGFRFSSDDARQQHGVGFIVNKTEIKWVISCTPVSNRIFCRRSPEMKDVRADLSILTNNF